MSEDILLHKIRNALVDLEGRGDIVLCASAPEKPAKYIFDALSEVVPNNITASELTGLRALVLQAISDPRFFDWEMPSLTGFSAEEFRRIAEKLPKG
jgi:hypothetical protein